jgi:two-component system OmpR family sensor kinase
VFEVDDDGPGFAAGEEAQAFEPFRKPDAGRAAAGESVGLGLSLVRRIVEAHGGRVQARNRQGGGATVSAVFPA